MGKTNARLATILLATLLLTAIFAASAFAAGATFSNELPAGTIGRQPSLVGVTAFSTTALRSGSQLITIDGTSVRAYVNMGSTSGYWSESEVWDEAKQAYVIKWTWVKSTTSPNKATIYGYPTAALADGVHNVAASIKDTAGVTSTDRWSFTIGVPPVIGTPTPAAGSTVATLTPTITVPVTDNDPRPMTATATVNGAAVSASVSGGVVTFHSPKLSNDSIATVTVTVSDASGNKSSKTWSFTVLIYADMFNMVGDCNTCHPYAATDNDMADDCSMCHDGQIDTPHQGTPASFHANTDSSCTPCHVTELTNEHARWPSKAGTPITCMTCHASTNPNVISAIALGNAQCGSCHDASNPHQGIDMSATHSIDPLSAAFTIQGKDLGSHSCTDCHYANVVSNHGGDCAACHPTAASAASPWDKTCASVGCHTVTSSVPMHTTLDSDHNQPALTAACSVVGCHDAGSTVPFVGRSIADFHSVATTTVAGQTRTSCTICHRPGVTATSNCLTAGCHADRAIAHGYLPERHAGTPTAQTFSIGGASYPALACANCHDTELGIEHTKPTSVGNTGCSECHPAKLLQLPPPWDKTTCAQGNCHAGISPEPMHGSIEASHTRLGANNACFASGCHADANLAALHSDAATTVAGVPRTSCMVCHAGGVPSSRDCTTCHADKVASHYIASQHTATVTSGTMTIQGVDLGTHACADCHGALQLGPIHTAGCATCHPTPAASAKPWNGSCATVDCHTPGSTRPMHVGIDDAHNQPALLGDCEVGGCHDASGPLPLTGKSIAEIHSDATTTVAGVTRSSCTICHAAGITLTNDCLTSGCHADRADPHGYDPAKHAGTPAPQTFSISGTTYPAVPCANCHDTELGIEHTKTTSSGNTGCGECHATLVAQLPPPWDKNTCAQGRCHTATSDAPLHGTIDTAHARLSANDACFAAGCHAGANLAAIHSDATTTVAGVPRTSCMLCHSDGVPTSADCTSCHPEKTASHYDSVQHTANLSATADMSVKGVDFGSHACNECHQTAEVGPIHGGTCSTCHPQPAKSAKPWDKNCVTGGCHTAGSTRPMHGQIDSAHTIAEVSCTEAGCHTGEFNAAAVHTKEGCATCHGAGKTPTLTCTTSGCHANMDGHGDVSATHASTVTTGVVEFFDAGTQHAIDRNGAISFEADCTMCHGVTNLLTLHGNDCTVCHLGSTTPRQSFGTWGKTCQQGDCHPTYHDTASGGHDYEYRTYDSCDCHNHDVYSPNSDFCGGCHFVGADTAPPTSFSNAVTSYDGTAAVGIWATDNKRTKSTYYRLDAGGTAKLAGGVVIVPPPATGTASHTIEYWSVDWAGNVELPHQMASFSVEADITSPVTTSDVKTAYIGPVVIALNPSDNGTSFGVKTTYYRFDDDPVQEGVTARYPQPSAGTEQHTFHYWSVDYAGNVETQHDATFTVTADTVAPTTTSDLLPAPKWYPAGPTMVTLTSVDPIPSSGIAGVHLDSSNPSAWWGDLHEASYNAALGVWQLKVWLQANGTYPIQWAARDAAGNIEGTQTITIQADVNLPVTSSNVTANATYVGNQTFTLTPSDTGGSGLANTYWQLDSTTGPWTEGTSVPVSAPTSNTVSHVLYYYSRDNATNVEYRKAVLFYIKPTGDSTPPTGSIVINAGAAWVTTTTCTLTLSATDSGSGVWQMRFSNDNNTWSAWQTYATSKTWTLDASPGTKRVYAQYRDTIGNVSTSYSDTIGLDMAAPTGTITIRGGAAWTNSTTTSLTLSASDATGSGMSQMRFSNDNSTWSAWETYATSKASWALTAGAGTKTVYAQFRDVAGNSSGSFSDTIGYEVTAPITTSNIAAGTTYTGSQTFTLTPTDSGGSGVAGTWWQLDSTAGAWTSGTSVPVSPPGSGTVSHTLYWYSRDNAGNQEANKSVTFSIRP